jgi:hypothetical protein
MSTTAISNPIIYSPVTAPASQPRSTALRNELQQLGSDLQSGNLSAAQQDYVTLSKSGPLANTQSTNPLVQALQAVGTALQGGNLTTAQQAFTTFQQAVQQQGEQAQGAGGQHHHHFHRGGGGSGGEVNSELSQACSRPCRQEILRRHRPRFRRCNRTWHNWASTWVGIRREVVLRLRPAQPAA